MSNILIYGINGYIGNFLKYYIQKENKNINILNSTHKKVKSKQDIIDDIKLLKPDRIISSIGFVKTDNCPNTTFLDNKEFLEKNIQNNLYIHNIIMDACLEYNIHFTYISTGCIFGSNKLFYDEDDEPDFFENNYSIVKGFTDKLLSIKKNEILILRIRQCISEYKHPQNFLTKFLNFKYVNDMDNSYTVIPSIFPLISKLIIYKHTGIFNCVNKNTTSVEKINKVFGLNKEKLKSNNYSNVTLSTKNLEKYFEVENIDDAINKIKLIYN